MLGKIFIFIVIYHMQSHIHLYINTYAFVYLCVCLFKHPQLLLNVRTQTSECLVAVWLIVVHGLVPRVSSATH